MDLKSKLLEISQLSPCSFSNKLGCDGRIKVKEGTASTYEGIEMALSWSELSIINLMRDNRGDDGDDSGYIIAYGFSKKSLRYYIYISCANYEGDVANEIFTENHPSYLKSLENIDDPNGSYPDFISFETEEEAGLFLEQFVKDLDECFLESIRQKDDDDQYFYGSHYVEEYLRYRKEYNKDWDMRYMKFLSICFSPYTEAYPSSYNIEYNDYASSFNGYFNKDKETILSLTKIDNRKFYKLKEKLDKSKLEQWHNEINLLRFKLENPENFKFDTIDFERIKIAIGREYSFQSNYLFNDISYYDIEDLLEGYCEMLEIKSSFDIKKMSGSIKAIKHNEIIDISKRETRTLSISCLEKGVSGTEVIAWVKKSVTLKDAISYLYSEIDNILDNRY